jgi:hypothetical protein
LTITAFDANGQPAIAPGAQFFITDTTKSAHFDAGGTLLTGDHVGNTVIVGQLASLQTSPVTVPVTNLPAKMVKVSLDSMLVVPFSVDTTVKAVSNISLNVLSAQDSASQGIIVRYTLVRPLAPRNASRPAVLITDPSGKPATADTTTASGSSTRQVAVFPALLGDAALLAGTKTDSVIVEARASYKGAELDGSPIVFTIPVRVGTP